MVANVGALSLTSSRWMKTGTWLLCRELSADQTQKSASVCSDYTHLHLAAHFRHYSKGGNLMKKAKLKIENALFLLNSWFLNNLMLTNTFIQPATISHIFSTALLWLFMYLCKKRCDPPFPLITSCILWWHINTMGEMRGVNTNPFQDLSCFFLRKCSDDWKNIITFNSQSNSNSSLLTYLTNNWLLRSKNIKLFYL